VSARRGGAARRISSWRRTVDAPVDDGPPEAGLEGWISDLAGGETSVRRLRKRLEATRGEPEKVVPAPGRVPSPTPDHELAGEMAGLVG
jgi:hypothetical protein